MEVRTDREPPGSHKLAACNKHSLPEIAGIQGPFEKFQHVNARRRPLPMHHECITDPVSSPTTVTAPTPQSGEAAQYARDSTHKGDMAFEQIAICGMACRLPGGIHSPQDLWQFLMDGKDARGEVPKRRYNASSHHSSKTKPATINSTYGYFLDDSIKLDSLDTTFFSISKTELERTDPQQRQLLEVARECVDDAGEVQWRGSNTGVYAGNFGEDWCEMFAKDHQQYGGYRITGTSDMALSNRVSYEMDLRGPSLTIRTGCSASLVCLNEACAAISKGDCDAAIVGGTNLIIAPGLTATASEQGILSPDASCKTFSADANGYARAEGIVAIYIKPLMAALRDGNPVRAIIRGIATNSDGKTPGLTQPSTASQEALMRRTYRVAGIDDVHQTAFVECHGTGTPTGDPIETAAVANVFGQAGVLIGSIKPNLGHSEGASGLASLIKCVLALEHATIPPNIKFSNPNPRIPFKQAKLEVPTKPLPWPESRAKRISLNSFGFGGSNAHVIIDAAHHQMLDHKALTNGHDKARSDHALFLSANTAESLQTLTSAYKGLIASGTYDMRDIAFTLANRREHMPCRTFTIACKNGTTLESPHVKIGSALEHLVMVFTGQGSQWAGMGRELYEVNPVFKRSLDTLNGFLGGISDSAAAWDLVAELHKPPKHSRLHTAEIAQPSLTAIQVALVDTLAALGIVPTAVIGHSGGEVAAAYAAGALTAEEAIIVTLHRGFAVTEQTKEGTMAAIGLSWDETTKYLLPGVGIACDNSPSSVTISGDAEGVRRVVNRIRSERSEVLTKLLNVDKAYHSAHMVEVGERYYAQLQGQVHSRQLKLPFYSSVAGKLYNVGHVMTAKYWQKNLESPVLFRSALTELAKGPLGRDAVYVEVGPHGALAGAVRQTLKQVGNTSPYVAILNRNEDGVVNFLSALGKLYTLNLQLQKVPFPASESPESINGTSATREGTALTSYPKAWYQQGQTLAGLPPYPWHYGSTYWHETRIVREWRQQTYAHHDLLGLRIAESTDFEPAWRNLLHLDSAPWLRDHVVTDDIVFPLAGYIGIVGEAIRQVGAADDGFEVRNVAIKMAMLLREDGPTEILTTFKRVRLTSALDSDWWEFTVTSHNGHVWTKHCLGEVACLNRVLPVPGSTLQLPRRASVSTWYRQMTREGFRYGPQFQTLHDVRTTTRGQNMATAHVKNNRHGDESNYHIHPTMIDAVLQLLCCADTHGLARKYRKLLPTLVRSLAVRKCDADLQLVVTTSRKAGTSGGVFGQAICLAGQDAFMQASDIKLSWLEDTDQPLDKDPHAAAYYHWAPHVDFQSLDRMIVSTIDRSASAGDLEELTQMCVAHWSKLSIEPSSAPHLGYLQAWIQKQVEKNTRLKQCSSAELLSSIKETVQRLQTTSAANAASAMLRIAESASELCDGSRDAKDVLRKANLLDHVFASLETTNASLYYQRLTHSRPNLAVLELCFGTGSTSARILSHMTMAYGRPLYSRYTVAVMMPKFAADVEANFKAYSGVEVKPWNIFTDEVTADLEGQFDLVIASHVLHATSSISKALRSARSLLVSDGQLLLQEGDSPSSWAKYVFGTMPGWWIGSHDGRHDHPYPSAQVWTYELQEAGFNLKGQLDFDAFGCFQRNLVFLAEPTDTSRTKPVEVNVLCAPGTNYGAVDGLKEQLKRRGWVPNLCYDETHLPKGQDIIVILDDREPFLNLTNQRFWSSIKAIMMKAGAANLLWVTKPCHFKAEQPQYAKIIGLARTLRSEMFLNFATCESENFTHDTNLIVDLFESMTTRQCSNKLGRDFEFAIHDGNLHVARFMPFRLHDGLIESKSTGELALTLGNRGRLRKLEWGHQSPRALKADEVEVATRAVGLNFVDILTRMGVVELSEPTLGHEASGIIRAVGANVKNLQVGDRVMLAGRSTFATSNVLSQDLCVKIPQSLDFIKAASMPVIYLTAMQALLEVGQLSKGQSVLIHSGCGGVGLAAIQLAQMMETTVYVTVGSPEKIEYLVNTMDIPRHHIFHSRDATFVNDIMRETNGRGVDLAMNSLSGDLLHATWRCIAEFGTMVEIGKRDLIGAGKLDMDVFLANRSYCCVDVDQMCVQRPWAIRRLLIKIVELLEEGRIKPVSPIHAYDAAQVQDAFSFMQSGQHIGKIVIEIPQRLQDHVQHTELARNISPTQFSSHASYLLVGGLGGIGRSIAIWMAEHGARHLIFMSPTAGSKKTHMDLAEELDSMGCAVHFVPGDVTKRLDVGKAVAAATAKAPIKGICQMSAVLRDRAFTDMSITDWEEANAPKVDGTYWLHHETQYVFAQLDFFILFSSLSGIIGLPGQANYCSANTYLDAFVSYRAGLGLPISAINIGHVHDVGFVAEDEMLLRKIGAMSFHQISEESLFDALNYAIKVGKAESVLPDTSPESGSVMVSQASRGYINPRIFVLGLGSTGPINDSSNATIWKDIRMGLYHAIDSSSTDAAQDKSPTADSKIKALLQAAKTDRGILAAPDSHAVLATEIGRRLFSFLLRPEDEEPDVTATLASLGMDSLVAIEMRAWWRQTLGFDVTVLEMLQMGTLEALGQFAGAKLAAMP